MSSEATGITLSATTNSEQQSLHWLDAAVTATGGQQRKGQRTMTVEVARALEKGTHLLVQAGTGTGKSLAYLVPALQHAVHADRPVVVATATLALQAQIISRDAPTVLEALQEELPRPMKVALLKGRSNYACRYRLSGGLPSDADVLPLFDTAGSAQGHGDSDSTGEQASSLGREVMRLRKWAETSDEGDRDELVPGVTDQAWRQVSVSARECIGASRCPFADECFSELARERAGNADVIVTNHAMLAIAAFEGLQVLPEFDAVIVDEAHEFADRVTGAVTAQLSGSMVRAAATTARRHGALAVNDLSEAAELLDAAYATAPSGWLKQGPNPMQVVALEAIRDASRQGLSDLKAGSTPDDGETKQAKETAERHLVRSRLQELIEVTERILDSGPGNATQQVAWATRPGHFEPGQGWITGDETEPPLLFVAPLSIAGRLRENLLAEATCVLTSATLTIGSSFDPIAGSLGFAGAGAPQWTGIDVGSPFDYPSQGILYVAGHLPKPGRFATEEFYQELEELIRASNGGVLGLFSSRRAAEEAAEEMRQRMGRNPKILCQGDATLSALVREFSEEQDSCLFGTMSLWQGVDVPGRACRLVIIDRIPFPRPDDPLSTARAHDISKHGGNGFMRVSASHAAVRLAQGAGRLIRSTGDRGVVAVLDSRLHSARYGQFLRSTLPDFWYTHDGQITKSALRRLGEDKGQ